MFKRKHFFLFEFVIRRGDDLVGVSVLYSIMHSSIPFQCTLFYSTVLSFIVLFFFNCSVQWIVSIGHCILYSAQLRCTKTCAVPCIVYVSISFDMVVQCKTGTHSNNNHWFITVNFWNETCYNIQWTVYYGVVPVLLILSSFKILSKRRVIWRL